MMNIENLFNYEFFCSGPYSGVRMIRVKISTNYKNKKTVSCGCLNNKMCENYYFENKKKKCFVLDYVC